MEFQGKTIFSTEFKNERDKPIRGLENGKVFFMLAPGQKIVKHSIDPSKSYAPFSRIIYLKNGEVEVKKNPDWNPPEWWGPDPLITEFLNLSSTEEQGIRVNEELVECYRGIPRFVPIRQLNTEFAMVAKATWRETTRKEPDPATQNLYMRTVTFTEMVKTPRSNSDLKDIEKRLRSQAEAEAKKDVDGRMKRLTEQAK
jgi:hypothetical protein